MMVYAKLISVVRGYTVARKSKESTVEPSVFRVMIEQFPYKHVTIDFATKEEALDYVHSLTEKDTAFYGVYEISPIVDYLISIEHRRLRPHDDTAQKISKSNTVKRRGRRRSV